MKSAEEDTKVAESLFRSRYYNHCLFFCHLFVEKILKAYFTREKDDTPPPTHDLLRLAKRTSLEADESLEKDLEEITTFNIRARYNNIKREFYKKATKDYTSKWFKRSEEIYQWIKKQI